MLVSIVSYSCLSLMIIALVILIGAFNQEKALVGAFSVIVKTDCGTDGALHSTRPGPGPEQWRYFST